MNTGTPAVSGEGAMGVITPHVRTADHVGDVNEVIPFPEDWPRTRRPTPEEWARIQAARRMNEDQEVEGKVA